MIVAILLSLPVLVVICLFGMARFSVRPDHLGHENGQLAEVPESPNAVSSQTSRDSHRMDAIPFSGSSADAMHRLRDVCRSQPGATVISQDEQYLHAEFRSKLFQFVDDVEFVIDDEVKVIHFRSASRVGHSDLGANRQRMADVRRQFIAADTGAD